MSTEGWVVPVTIVTSATGNLTQLYPAFVTAGVAPPGTNGQLLRRPMQGGLHSIQIEPDGANGGEVEIYDIDGAEVGADVSSGTTITNAQLVAGLARGVAKLIWRQQYSGTVGSGPVNASGIYREFNKGLAVRVHNDGDAGTCTLNLVVSGGFFKTESRGP